MFEWENSKEFITYKLMLEKREKKNKNADSLTLLDQYWKSVWHYM